MTKIILRRLGFMLLTVFIISTTMGTFLRPQPLRLPEPIPVSSCLSVCHLGGIT